MQARLASDLNAWPSPFLSWPPQCWDYKHNSCPPEIIFFKNRHSSHYEQCLWIGRTSFVYHTIPRQESRDLPVPGWALSFAAYPVWSGSPLFPTQGLSAWNALTEATTAIVSIWLKLHFLYRRYCFKLVFFFFKGLWTTLENWDVLGQIYNLGS